MWIIVIQDHDLNITEVSIPLEKDECMALLIDWGYHPITEKKWIGRDQWAVLIEPSDLRLLKKGRSN